MPPLPFDIMLARSYRRIRNALLLAIAVLTSALAGVAMTLGPAVLTSLSPFVYVTVALAVLGASGAVGAHAQRRQDIALRTWGDAHAWAHQSHLRPQDAAWGALPVTAPGDRRISASDIQRGEHRGRPVVTYTLTWTTIRRLGKKSSAVRHTQHVIAARLSQDTTSVSIAPVRLGCRRGATALDSNDFDARFAVHTTPGTTAQALLDPGVRRRLLDLPSSSVLTRRLPVWPTAYRAPALSDTCVLYGHGWVAATWAGVPDVHVSEGGLALVCDLADRVPEQAGTRAHRAR